ncbi:MAG TPA: glycosyltransferase family 4 protein [Sphingomonas sp.]|nr:glycosyltransferase family 4 protein [Sphingomonas sp.]
MTRLLITTDTVGGVWQYATDLAAALAPQGFEPILVTLGPRPSAAQKADLAPGVELVETDLPLDWLAETRHDVMAAGQALTRLAEMLRADIVQLNAPAFAAGPRFGCPVVAVAHSCVGTWWQAVKGGEIDADLAWRAALTGAGLRAADRVVAPSAAFSAMLRHCYDLPDAPLVVRNGRRVRAAVARAQEDFAFTAGRLWDAGKNVAVLDRAAAMIPVPLKAAGPAAGPHGAYVSFDRVAPLGLLDDAALAQILAARPVFLSASIYEPFGLAVLEAAQAGCALILSDIPTFRELWDGAARFVYPHDAAGFARAIEDIVGDAALRARLGEAAQARAADYAVERMAAEMATLYRALVADAAAGERAAA